MRRVPALALIGVMVISMEAFGSTPAGSLQYFPDVTEEMSSPEYWLALQEDPEKLLMTDGEIKDLNRKAMEADGTGLCDLKELPEEYDGIQLSDDIRSEAEKTAKDYDGWTFDGDGNEASPGYYEAMIANGTDPDAKEHMPIGYGIAVKVSALHAFASERVILDDPEDPELDYQYLTGVRVNEPLVLYLTSKDGKWYYAQSICYRGWIPAEDVAVCSNRDQWLDAWDFSAQETMVVWGSRVVTVDSIVAPQSANRVLTMGTTLEMVPSDLSSLVNNRTAYHNYTVYLPVRRPDGSYEKKEALIPAREKVHAGFLPLTKANILHTAFEMLGNPYGWGGMLTSDDCSGYIRNVYKCFGLELGRDTDYQINMPATGISMEEMDIKEKEETIDALPAGAILFLDGHEMLYLGKADDHYYVINSMSSVMNPQDGESRQRVRGVVINTLDVKRTSGVQWMEGLIFACTFP